MRSSFNPGRNLFYRVKRANNSIIIIDYDGVETASLSSDYLDNGSIKAFELRFDFVQGVGFKRFVDAGALRK